MATQSSWLTSFWIPEEREAFSHPAFLDKNLKEGPCLVLLESHAHPCGKKQELQFDAPSVPQGVEVQCECHFFKVRKILLTEGARDTVQIKATGIYLSRGDRQYKKTILRVW